MSDIDDSHRRHIRERGAFKAGDRVEYRGRGHKKKRGRRGTIVRIMKYRGDPYPPLDGAYAVVQWDDAERPTVNVSTDCLVLVEDFWS